MITVNPATVAVEGVEYQLELGKIESTHIGWEDHGIFSVNVDLSFSSAHQGTGHFAIKPNHLMDFIKLTLGVVGVSRWEDLPNESVYVLRTSPLGMIKGFLSLGQTKVLLFSEVFKD